MASERVAVTVEELLAHRGWVHALAKSLVTDANDADELEQRTWMDAIERPPPHRANLRAWLARVVRRRRLDLGRGERRRDARERAQPARTSESPPDEALERAETRARIATEVLALPEPYRATVLLRYFEGMSAREVAACQAVPEATVRTRTARALDLLRGRLKDGLGRRRMRSLLLPIAGSAPATAAWTAAGGVLAMTAKAKVLAIAGAVALLSGGVWIGTGGLDRETSSPSDASSLRVVREDASTTPRLEGVRGVESGNAGALPRNVREGEGVANGTVAGTVRDAGGAPIVGAAAFLWNETGTTLLVKSATAADGSFRFEGLADEAHLLSLHTDRETISLVVRPGGRRLDVELTGVGTPTNATTSVAAVPPVPPAHLSGVVVEEGTDRPLAGIGVRAVPEGADPAALQAIPIPSIQTTQDGTFSLSLPSVGPGRWMLDVGPRSVPAGAGRAEDEWLLVRAGPFAAGASDVRVALARAESIEGEVLARDGTPRRARIRATPVVDGVRLGYDPVREWHPLRFAASEADGKFRVVGLMRTPHDLRVETWEGGFATLREIPAGTKGLVVHLVEGRKITGRITDDAGEPVQGTGWVQVCEEGSAPGSPECTSPTMKEGGAFETAALDPALDYVVRAGGFTGYARGETSRVRPGDGDVVVRLEKGVTLSGRLLDATGRPVPGVRVSAVGVDRPILIEGVVPKTDADGHFEIVAPRGTVRLGTMRDGTYVPLGETEGPRTDLELRLPR